jgi:hypothetical protein
MKKFRALGFFALGYVNKSLKVLGLFKAEIGFS